MSADPTRHVYTHPSPVEHWRHMIEIVALIIAAVWGVYVFIYQERIKPAGEAPNLDFHADVQHENLPGNLELVKLSFTWHNLGSTPAQIDGVAADVFAESFGKFADSLHRVPSAVPDRGYNSTIFESRGNPSHGTLIATYFHPWRPMGGRRRAYLEPAQAVTMQLVEVVIPRGRFTATSAAIAYCFRRGDDARSDVVVPPRKPDGSFDTNSLAAAEQRAHLDAKPACVYTGTGEQGL